MDSSPEPSYSAGPSVRPSRPSTSRCFLVLLTKGLVLAPTRPSFFTLKVFLRGEVGHNMEASGH